MAGSTAYLRSGRGWGIVRDGWTGPGTGSKSSYKFVNRKEIPLVKISNGKRAMITSCSLHCLPYFWNSIKTLKIFWSVLYHKNFYIENFISKICKILKLVRCSEPLISPLLMRRSCNRLLGRSILFWMNDGIILRWSGWKLMAGKSNRKSNILNRPLG